MDTKTLTAIAVAAMVATGCDPDKTADTNPSTSAPTGSTGTDPTDTSGTTTPDDADQDGYTVQDGDCDDFNNTVYPGAMERNFDGLDSDCDGQDAPALGDDRYDEALAILDTSGDGVVSLDEFEAACAESAHLFGDARPGVVHTEATCGGTGLGRGFVLHPWNEFHEHDCRGVNECAGWTCVETAAGADRDGPTLFEEELCSWCHTGEKGAFLVEVAPEEDAQEAVDTFLDRSDTRFRSAIAFGKQGISPGDVAYSNMPAYYLRMSRAEMDTAIAYVRSLPLDSANYEWGDLAEPE